MVPSTVDPDANGSGNNKGPKRGVRISAWKLAKLDSSEAMKAAAKARASSSVLRPVDNNRRLPDSELSSSDNASVRSSMSTETGGNKEYSRNSPLRHSFAPSQGSRDEYETGTHSMSSFSSPTHHESVTLSPLPQAHGASSARGPVPDQHPTSRPPALNKNNNPVFHNSSGFDEKIMQRHSTTDPLLVPVPTSQAPASLFRDVKRTSVVWDQEAGRYVSVPVSASEARKKPSLPLAALPNPNAAMGILPREPLVQPQARTTTTVNRQSEKLMYSGESSIFFGGPLLSALVKDGSREEPRDGLDKQVAINLPRETRFKRDAVSNQLPVFVPGDFDLNPSSGSGLKK